MGKMNPGPSGMGVYAIFDKAGKLLYVGRSKVMEIRAETSRLKHGGFIARGINTPNRETARALEDMLIRSNDLINGGKNKINGMSDKVRFSEQGAGYYEELQQMLSKLSLL
jgi:hypothetical protein